MESYRDLVVWPKGMDLAETVYQVTHGWPKDEQYGLTNQVRRAVVSLPATIAEGQGRTGAKEFLHHLSIAKGSLHEVETHLLLAQRLTYIAEATAHALLRRTDEVGRLLLGLIRSVRLPSDR